MKTTLLILGTLATGNVILAAFYLVASCHRSSGTARILRRNGGFTLYVNGRTTGNFATASDAERIAKLNGYETEK